MLCTALSNFLSSLKLRGEVGEKDKNPGCSAMPRENWGPLVLIWKVLNSMLECRKNKVWSSWGPGQLHGHADHFLLGAHFCKFMGTLDASRFIPDLQGFRTSGNIPHCGLMFSGWPFHMTILNPGSFHVVAPSSLKKEKAYKGHCTR